MQDNCANRAELGTFSDPSYHLHSFRYLAYAKGVAGGIGRFRLASHFSTHYCTILLLLTVMSNKHPYHSVLSDP